MFTDNRYTIFNQAPPDENGNPGMIISLNLKSLLSMFEDGWQKVFKEKYGRAFDVEEDIAKKINNYPKGFEWMNGLPIDLSKAFQSKQEIWTPGNLIPEWINKSHSYILLAQKILKQGRNLAEMHWRDFEKLIGDLLEFEGWNVDVTRSTKDGGVDVIAIKTDPTLGLIKSVWQAKRYGNKSLVQVKDVRELSALIDNLNATKGIVVTKSFNKRCNRVDKKRYLQNRLQRSKSIERLDYKIFIILIYS